MSDLSDVENAGEDWIEGSRVMSGSHNLVKERIGNLNAVELARIPDELEEALEKALTGSHQNLKLAKEIAALMLTGGTKPDRS